MGIKQSSLSISRQTIILTKKAPSKDKTPPSDTWGSPHSLLSCPATGTLEVDDSLGILITSIFLRLVDYELILPAFRVHKFTVQEAKARKAFTFSLPPACPGSHTPQELVAGYRGKPLALSRVVPQHFLPLIQRIWQCFVFNGCFSYPFSQRETQLTAELWQFLSGRILNSALEN